MRVTEIDISETRYSSAFIIYMFHDAYTCFCVIRKGNVLYMKSRFSTKHVIARIYLIDVRESLNKSISLASP